RLQVLARTPQLQVEAAQRAAAVAADEAAGVQAGSRIAQLLHQRQAYQRLHAAQVDAAVAARVAVFERVVGIEAVEAGAVGGRWRGQFCGTGHYRPDRKSTRLNSSHVKISYAVFCLKKKKKQDQRRQSIDDCLARCR